MPSAVSVAESLRFFFTGKFRRFLKSIIAQNGDRTAHKNCLCLFRSATVSLSSSADPCHYIAEPSVYWFPCLLVAVFRFKTYVRLLHLALRRQTNLCKAGTGKQPIYSLLLRKNWTFDEYVEAALSHVAGHMRQRRFRLFQSSVHHTVDHMLGELWPHMSHNKQDLIRVHAK